VSREVGVGALKGLSVSSLHMRMAGRQGKADLYILSALPVHVRCCGDFPAHPPLQTSTPDPLIPLLAC
jgi:hypothetical protein